MIARLVANCTLVAMKNFWTEREAPILCLAPMADVTDAPFREMIAKYGKPDVTWTEFVSADGLYHTREIQKLPDDENPLMKDLLYTEGERPIVAQVFTSKPDMMEYVAKLVVELGYDGMDINMGCPHKAIEKQGAGAAHMKEKEHAIELIRTAKKALDGRIPLSVKTRIGYNKDELREWLPMILKEQPAAVTIHARTRKEMSNVPARWEHVAEAVQIRDELMGDKDIRIIGNGDVQSVEEGRQKCLETGADGAMVGRGIFGKPWFFAETEPDIEERFRIMIEHCRLFEKYCSHKSFAVMKKHFKAYVTGFKGSKELRIALFATNSVDEVEELVQNYLKSRV